MAIRVLHIFGQLGRGGAESRIFDVFSRLDRVTVDFDFVTMTKKDEGQDFIPIIEGMGGRVFRIDSPREVGFFEHIRQLRKIMSENGPYDAVHAHTSYHCGLVLFAAKKEKIKIRIAHARTSSVRNKGSLKNRLYVLAGRLLISYSATHRLAISNDAGKFLFGKKKFRVVPNAIDYVKYADVKNEEVQAFREREQITGSAGGGNRDSRALRKTFHGAERRSLGRYCS